MRFSVRRIYKRVIHSGSLSLIMRCCLHLQTFARVVTVLFQVYHGFTQSRLIRNWSQNGKLVSDEGKSVR